MAAAAPVLECIDVSAGYHDAAGPKAILRKVSFSVAEGELLVLLGRSGSGKSTLLRLLNRFCEPLAGTVRYREKSLLDWDPLGLRRRVALVQQTPVVFEGTVRDNLLLHPRGTAALTEADLTGAVADVGLEPSVLSRVAAELSVGEQQRVCVARALLTFPEVLLLDEPTAALDPQNAMRLAELVSSLRERRKLTTLVVTHDPALVRKLAGRIMLLRDGSVDAQPARAAVDEFLAGT